jgi:2-oxoglutarate dehydrogenase E2 component (dihydrolipoamide succinyltransferase)
MPQLGETVADGTVAKWFKRPGESVEKGEPLFEVSTDKVDTEIPAQTSGVLSAIYVQEGETVDVGTLLAEISDGTKSAVATEGLASNTGATSRHLTGPSQESPSLTRQAQLSPVVRKLLRERGIAAGDIEGTGPGGRITKDDVVNFKAPIDDTAKIATHSPVVRKLLGEHGIDASSITASSPDGRLTRRDVETYIAEQGSPLMSPHVDDEIVPFTRIRRLTADHMVRSKATSAHTLMVREVDYQSVERARTVRGAQFKEREGFSLTYLPFIAFAAVQALVEFPHLNASVGENELLVHQSVNLGIAVDLGSDGLVVPVIRDAGARTFLDLARAIRQRAIAARNSQLGVDDFAGGTFTITNPGPFGTLMTGAIINQPQVGILSTDGVTRRPVVVVDDTGEESIAIHSVGLLALTFDHRAIDGAYAARYLQKIAVIIASTDWAGLTP